MVAPDILLSCSTWGQQEVLWKLLNMCFPSAKTILDPTYGNGGFWKNYCGACSVFRGDILPDRAIDQQVDFTDLRFDDATFDVVVYDPPFQPATTDGIIGERFTKPVRGVGVLRDLVQRGLREVWRVSKQGIIVKAQDYIHDHKPVWMSLWLVEVLGEPYECVHVIRRGKLIAKNWSHQRSVWRNHSSFFVFSRKAMR